MVGALALCGPSMRLHRLAPGLLLVTSLLGPAEASALVRVSQVDAIHSVVDVEVVDGLAYVLDAGPLGPRGEPINSVLRTLDVSDPAGPVQLGALDTLIG